jgi:hypothetical protein
MGKEYTFHSPKPEKLGRVTNTDFDRVAPVGQAMSYKYADPSIPSYILSSSSLSWSIDPDGNVGLATGVDYSNQANIYDTRYVTRQLARDERETVVAIVKPFVDVGKDWLHPDEAIIVDFFRHEQDARYSGDWHFDGTPGSDDFRGVIFYDRFPTDFAVGRIVLDVPDEQYPPSPKQIDFMISNGRIVQELAEKRGAITLMEGPEPLTGVGIANRHIHRVAAIPDSKKGTVRSFLRLGTRIKEK